MNRPRPLTMFPVPAGARASTCRSCGAVIYFAENEKTKRMHPIDCAPPGGVAPTADEPGRGVSHFATCPDADRWRGKGASR